MIKRPKVALIHTIHQIIPHLQHLFAELIPEAEPVHLLDETILPEAIEAGKLTSNIYQRVFQMIRRAEQERASIALITCSSISSYASEMASKSTIPILRIDEPMVCEACLKGRHIAVLATLKTTLTPTIDLVQSQATKLSKDVNVRSFLCEGAFVALQEGNLRVHDYIIQSHIEKAANWADVLILAQASMAEVIERNQMNVKKEVLTSPFSGISQISKWIREIQSSNWSK